MIIWLEDAFGPDNAVTIFWVGVVLLALIALLVIWLIIRRISKGVFVAGGRNRKARLAIMDATKVDDHRHLILVRRDDVEHLILIGGNSDIVVESDIRPPSTPRVETALDEVSYQQRAPEPARPQVVVAEPEPEIAPTLASRPVQTNLAPAPRPAPAPVVHTDLDDDLMRELQSALVIDPPSPPTRPASPAVEAPRARTSLDDEMAKLLGELSSQKR